MWRRDVMCSPFACSQLNPHPVPRWLCLHQRLLCSCIVSDSQPSNSSPGLRRSSFRWFPPPSVHSTEIIGVELCTDLDLSFLPINPPESYSLPTSVPRFLFFVFCWPPTNFRTVTALNFLFPPIPLNFRSRCLALMDCSPCLLPRSSKLPY